MTELSLQMRTKITSILEAKCKELLEDTCDANTWLNDWLSIDEIELISGLVNSGQVSFKTEVIWNG